MNSGFFIKVNKLVLKLTSTCNLFAFFTKNSRRGILRKLKELTKIAR